MNLKIFNNFAKLKYDEKAIYKNLNTLIFINTH